MIGLIVMVVALVALIAVVNVQKKKKVEQTSFEQPSIQTEDKSNKQK